MRKVQLMRISAVLFAFAACMANAESVAINLSSAANGAWCNVGGGYLVNCESMPSGQQLFNASLFSIAGANGGNNAWFSSVAANNGAGSVSLAIPVNLPNVTSVHTLLNTLWGQNGTSYDTVTFTGSSGAVYSVNLTGNYAIRDYNQYIWTNSLNPAANSVAVWNNYASGGGQRLDEQTFILPQAFGDQTLETITITDNGANVFSRIFLAGLTVDTAAADPASSVPEPAVLLLTAGGLIAMGLLRRRSRK